MKVRYDMGHEGERFGSIEAVLKTYDQVAETTQQTN